MVSVIAPAYKNPTEVDALLASLALRCSPANAFEVIVVDDGSGDDALRQTCATYPFARVLSLPTNRGAASARNAGVKMAKFDLLLFLDSDHVVLTDVIDIVVKMFRDSSIIAAVGSVSPEPLNPGYFTNFWGLVKAFSLPKGQYSSAFFAQIGAIRKSIFNKVGGFDGNIKGASIEEYEFSLRFDAHRYRVHYNPDLLVRTHYKGVYKSLVQSFSRSAKWVLLFGERKRFDNHTTTVSQALAAICGTCLIASGVLTALGYLPIVLPAILLIMYLWINGQFFRYVGTTAGAWFVPVSVFFHLMLSLVVTIGAARGAVQLLFGPERRKAMLYR